MANPIIDNQLVKQVLTSSKTVAMVGVSIIKKEEISKQYYQEKAFDYCNEIFTRIWLSCHTSKSFFKGKENIWRKQ